MTGPTKTTIGGYLIERLREHGVGHVFGVPGDFVLTFMHEIERSPLRLINTSDEQGAGFAADAYARMSGLGVVCVTYGVGGLKIANTTGQAYAEKSPVVVISGAPSMEERRRHPLIHHKVRSYDTQLRVFQQLTAAATVLDDPACAASEIDRVLGIAKQYSQPVYIELPRDTIDLQIDVVRTNDTYRSVATVNTSYSGTGTGCDLLPPSCTRTVSYGTRTGPAQTAYCETPARQTTWGRLKVTYR